MRKRAFTLIEIVIVIAIVGLMALAALPMFDRFSANAEIRDKADEIKLVYERAYRESISPKSGNNAVRVTISAGSNPTMVYEAGICSLNDNCQSFTAADSEDISFPAAFSISDLKVTKRTGTENYSPLSVIFMSPGNNTSIFFRDGASDPIAGTCTGIIFSLVRDNVATARTINLTINPFGVSI